MLTLSPRQVQVWTPLSFGFPGDFFYQEIRCRFFASGTSPGVVDRWIQAQVPVPKPEPRQPSPGGELVYVGNPPRMEYHWDPNCRFLGGAAALTLSETQAKARRYSPCNACQPLPRFPR